MCIEENMRYLRMGISGMFVVLAFVTAYAGTPGSFRGKIISDSHAPANKNWIYVQGRNGMVRRVEISRARVVYDADVPAADRASNPHDALKAGIEVRVTAEQGTDGEWRASRVEILQSKGRQEQTSTGAEPTQGPTP